MKAITGVTGVVCAALAGCAVEPQVGTAAQAVEGSVIAEYGRCRAYACLLFTAPDADHDGIPDDDEKALGTDPDSSRSRPSDRAELAHIGARDLPSWTQGQITVVVLPTELPDGTEVFGGKTGLPAREELFDLMKLGDIWGSFDLSHGVVVNPALGGPDLSLPGLGSTQSARDYADLEPDGTSHMASWFQGGLPQAAKDAWNTSPNGKISYDVPHYNAGFTGGGWANRSLEFTHVDGSVDKLSWDTFTDAEGTDYERSTLDAYDANGDWIKTTTISTSSRTDKDGGKHTSRSSSETNNMGEARDTMVTTDQYMKDDGSEWEESAWTDHQTNADGSTEDEKGSSTSYSHDGTTDDHSSSTTTSCTAGGDCSTSIHNTDNGADNPGTPCDASNDDCSGDAGAYRDPDYIEVVPDMDAVAMRISNAPVHTFNDPMVPPGSDGTYAPPKEDQRKNGVVILTTGDPDDAIMLREDWSLNTAAPEWDANLPIDEPTEPPPAGCLDCE